jgi:glycosyltransferase involved in cell wall biosynthesis
LIIAGRGEDLDSYFAPDDDRRHYEIINEYIPDEDVAGIFERSTITVLPYIESSQSGVAAVAFGTGTLVIASDVGGVGESINHEEDGLLVAPGDVPAFIRLLTDDQLQLKLRSAATKRCQEDLSWLTIAEQTVDVYHQAIKRS